MRTGSRQLHVNVKIEKGLSNKQVAKRQAFALL